MQKFFPARVIFHLLCCVCVIVQDIGKMLTLAADTIQELSRASPSSEVVEYKTKDFLKTVEVIWAVRVYSGMNMCVTMATYLGVSISLWLLYHKGDMIIVI